MTEGVILTGPSRNFEDIKKIDKNGVEYWEARELMSLLGYERWENFAKAISRAAKACIGAGEDVDSHFRGATKMVRFGSDSMRKVVDYFLDRYACYLIAQNGDPNKQEIALAQTYFAIQTRKQEIFEQLSADEKRLFIFVIPSASRGI
jgi:DNA-damage-inducible protein D